MKQVGGVNKLGNLENMSGQEASEIYSAKVV